ncbi:MAG: hypothetical protein WA916_08960 [Arcobacter sp.]|uniref:hypothetical protein n=1 Tax=Arcobacter sp. TaxID=1872629 RepID=UPI003C711F26
MTEIEAVDLITLEVGSIIKGESIKVVGREPINRREHIAVIAIVFKHNSDKELEVIKKVKDIAIDNPDVEFGGSDVDDKFDLKYSAIIVKIKVK